MDDETKRYLDEKFEHLEGWLKGAFDEMQREIVGLRAEMNHGFTMMRRDLQNLDRRVGRLETDRPAAAE